VFSIIKKLILIFLIINLNSCKVEEDLLLGDCRQVILVTAKDNTHLNSRLYLYELKAEGWKCILGPFPAVIGKYGWAWGRSAFFHIPPGRIKREGDLRSPAGVFSLGSAYGYQKTIVPAIRWPYRYSHKDLIAVDDRKSRFYNRIINIQSVPAAKRDWISYEKMRRRDHLYKWLIEIRHNYHRPKMGGGSAIFLHVYRNTFSPTAGCTAISEFHLLQLLRRLDPARNPRFILLPAGGRSRLTGRIFKILGFPIEGKPNM